VSRWTKILEFWVDCPTCMQFNNKYEMRQLFLSIDARQTYRFRTITGATVCLVVLKPATMPLQRLFNLCQARKGVKREEGEGEGMGTGYKLLRVQEWYCQQRSKERNSQIALMKTTENYKHCLKIKEMKEKKLLWKNAQPNISIFLPLACKIQFRSN
jgi:hypothetical protein